MQRFIGDTSHSSSTCVVPFLVGLIIIEYVVVAPAFRLFMISGTEYPHRILSQIIRMASSRVSMYGTVGLPLLRILAASVLIGSRLTPAPNKAPEPTPIGRRSSASRFTVVGAARLIG